MKNDFDFNHPPQPVLKVHYDRMGYSVYVTDDCYVRIDLGPDKLTERGAECVARIIKVVGLDCRFPKVPGAVKYNRTLVTDVKLRAWFNNEFPEVK